MHVLVLHYKSAISDCVNLNVHSKTGGFVFQLCPDYVFKQVSDPVELHDVFGLALQPELVKLYEEIAIKVMEVVKIGPALRHIVQMGLQSRVL